MFEFPIFKAPKGLAEELVEFLGLRDCYPLAHLQDMRPSLRPRVGVYVLYYKGAHALYESVSYANQSGCCLPIYVGKAVPKGDRTGLTENDEAAIRKSDSNLYSRLLEHRRSINQGEHLSAEDFSFRVAPMEINLVAWGEGVLIRHFQPVWNQIIPGFGIHQPGVGRNEQQRSVWDRLHPGRTLARSLPPAQPVNESVLKPDIDALCERMMRKLGCP